METTDSVYEIKLNISSPYRSSQITVKALKDVQICNVFILKLKGKNT